MPKNTIISSFKKLPKGLLIFAALVLSTEILLGIIRPQIVTIFWNKFTVNEHVLIDMPVDFDYLIMGDSVQKTGIDPTLVSDNLLSLGLPGAKPPSLYLLLNRYLKKHKPPRAIFLFIDPQDVHEAMYIILKYFVTPKEYVSLWRHLKWDERFHFFLRYWTTLDERLASVPMRQVYHKSNAAFIEELKRNRGYIPLPNENNSLAEDYFAASGERPQKGISIEARDFVYLDKLVTLARSHNIRLILLGNILPKELHDIAEKTGFNKEWLMFLDIVKKRYPDIELVSEPILYLENRYFGDLAHVNKEGRAIYTAYFKERIFAPFAKVAKEGRDADM